MNKKKPKTAEEGIEYSKEGTLELLGYRNKDKNKKQI